MHITVLKARSLAKIHLRAIQNIFLWPFSLLQRIQAARFDQNDKQFILAFPHNDLARPSTKNGIKRYIEVSRIFRKCENMQTFDAYLFAIRPMFDNVPPLNLGFVCMDSSFAVAFFP